MIRLAILTELTTVLDKQTELHVPVIKSNHIYWYMAALRLDYTITQSRPTQSHKVLCDCVVMGALEASRNCAI